MSRSLRRSSESVSKPGGSHGESPPSRGLQWLTTYNDETNHMGPILGIWYIDWLRISSVYANYNDDMMQWVYNAIWFYIFIPTIVGNALIWNVKGYKWYKPLTERLMILDTSWYCSLKIEAQSPLQRTSWRAWARLASTRIKESSRVVVVVSLAMAEWHCWKSLDMKRWYKTRLIPGWF
jgi:hypothetical protein